MTRHLAARLPRRRGPIVVAALLVATVLWQLDASPAMSQATSLVALRADAGPELDPDDSMWRRAAAVEVPLSAQNTTYPFGGGAVPAIRVQALHDGTTLFVRASWDDPTADASTAAVEDFADAVALQFPVVASSSAPSVCMGQADGGVNIWQWRADSEAPLPDSASALHADGYVDLYQSTEDLFFPAREVGNPYALGGRAVQDLVATGFGTLGPAGEQAVEGAGRWDDGTWTVVFARPFAAADEDRPEFGVGTTTDVALAAWNGDAGDRNGQKSISSFLRLSLSDEPLPAAPITTQGMLTAVGIVLVVLFAAVLGFTMLIEPRTPSPAPAGRAEA